MQKKSKIKIKLQKNEGFFGQYPLDEKSTTATDNNLKSERDQENKLKVLI